MGFLMLVSRLVITKSLFHIAKNGVAIMFYLDFFVGCHQWKFLIVKENRGNEGTCIGVCRWPITDQSHRSTADMWLYRAYRYVIIDLH